jgi:hypothetical protein
VLTLDAVRSSNFNGSANAVFAEKRSDLQLKEGIGTGVCGTATNKTLKDFFLKQHLLLMMTHQIKRY